MHSQEAIYMYAYTCMCSQPHPTVDRAWGFFHTWPHGLWTWTTLNLMLCVSFWFFRTCFMLQGFLCSTRKKILGVWLCARPPTSLFGFPKPWLWASSSGDKYGEPLTSLFSPNFQCIIHLRWATECSMVDWWNN